ncbi:hypothetical protein O181_074003, partial [Austropuccinia psidii MF-1]|nr:hypothetical protein [Austropuccinia psidii MF-1]
MNPTNQNLELNNSTTTNSSSNRNRNRINRSSNILNRRRNEVIVLSPPSIHHQPHDFQSDLSSQHQHQRERERERQQGQERDHEDDYDDQINHSEEDQEDDGFSMDPFNPNRTLHSASNHPQSNPTHHLRPISPPIQLPPTPPSRNTQLIQPTLNLSSPTSSHHPILNNLPYYLINLNQSQSNITSINQEDHHHQDDHHPIFNSNQSTNWISNQPSSNSVLPIELPSQLIITDDDLPITNQPSLDPISNSSSSSNQTFNPSNPNLFILNSNPNHPSIWRNSSSEQINHDFETSLGRSRVVNRLRQRLNDLRPPPETNHTLNQSSDFGTRNLVNTLHQIRTQRYHTKSFTNKNTYLLYCGNSQIFPSQFNHINHNTLLSDQLNQPLQHPGCGKLISARSTILNSKSNKWSNHHESVDTLFSSLLQRSPSNDLLLISDSCPLPNSLDQLDHESQKSFESDPSNPFSVNSGPRSFCNCSKTYLGCLTCGNIVGHFVQKLCQPCRNLSGSYTHYYYLNRLTAIPRYTNSKIALRLDQISPPSSSSPAVLAWNETLALKNNDMEAGLITNHCHQVASGDHFTTSTSNDNLASRARMSQIMRNAILIGSVKAGLPLNSSTSLSPQSSIGTMSIDYQPNQVSESNRSNRSVSFNPGSRLNRSNAITYSDYLRLTSRSHLLRSRSSSFRQSSPLRRGLVNRMGRVLDLPPVFGSIQVEDGGSSVEVKEEESDEADNVHVSNGNIRRRSHDDDDEEEEENDNYTESSRNRSRNQRRRIEDRNNNNNNNLEINSNRQV